MAEPPDNDSSDFVAQLDQGSAHLRGLGQMYAAMYRSLVESGVPENAATQITCTHIGKNKS
jgi:hypothetical protein